MIKVSPEEVKPGYFYSIEETSKILGISRTTLRKYTQLNRLAAIYFPFSGRTYYSGDDIIKVLDKRIGGRVILPFDHIVNPESKERKELEEKIKRFRAKRSAKIIDLSNQ
jgi:predicted site-specific integrase-resolvase